MARRATGNIALDRAAEWGAIFLRNFNAPDGKIRLVAASSQGRRIAHRQGDAVASDVLNHGPETPAEELRFETAQHAARVYERAKLFRIVVVFAAFAVSVARVVFPMLFPLVGNAPISAPALVGISRFASFYAISLELSARVQCQDCLKQYEASLRATRRSD